MSSPRCLLAIGCLALTLVACAQPPPTVAPAPTSPPVLQTIIVQSAPIVITSTPPPAIAAPVTPTATLPPPPPIKNSDTVVLATKGEPQSLDPAWDYEVAGEGIIQNVYQPLIFYQREKFDQYIGVLATGWKTSADGKTYTFTIRQGVKFQNGDPLTPSDVAYSYLRGFIQSQASGPQWIMLQPFFGPRVTTGFLDANAKPGDATGDDVVNAQFDGNFATACEAAKRLIVADDQAGTVTMHLKQSWGPFLASIANAWGSIVDQKWAIGLGDWDGNCTDAQKFNNPGDKDSPLFDKMNGTGPYILAKWDKGNQITLDANPNYWQSEPLWEAGPDGPAKIKHVLIKNIPEWGVRFGMLATGDADLAYVPTDFYAQVDPLVKEECDPAGSTPCPPVNANGFLRRFKGLESFQQIGVFFNQKVDTTGSNSFIGTGQLDGNGIPPDFFADLHIRKAFAACFDYDTFIQQVLGGNGIRTNGPVPPGEVGYNPNDPAQQFDLEACRSEFAAAAQEDKLKDLLTKGFYLAYVSIAGAQEVHQAGEILKEDLAKVNPKFKLNVIEEPYPVYLDDVSAGRASIYPQGWLEDYHDPNDWVGPYLGSGGYFSGSQGFDAGLQKQLDALILQGVTTTDQAARAAIYTRLNKMAIDNVLDIFLYAPVGRSYQQAWVQGWYYNPIYAGNYYYVLSKGQ